MTNAAAQYIKLIWRLGLHRNNKFCRESLAFLVGVFVLEYLEYQNTTNFLKPNQDFNTTIYNIASYALVASSKDLLINCYFSIYFNYNFLRNVINALVNQKGNDVVIRASQSATYLLSITFIGLMSLFKTFAIIAPTLISWNKDTEKENDNPYSQYIFYFTFSLLTVQIIGTIFQTFAVKKAKEAFNNYTTSVTDKDTGKIKQNLDNYLFIEKKAAPIKSFMVALSAAYNFLTQGGFLLLLNQMGTSSTVTANSLGLFNELRTLLNWLFVNGIRLSDLIVQLGIIDKFLSEAKEEKTNTQEQNNVKENSDSSANTTKVGFVKNFSDFMRGIFRNKESFDKKAAFFLASCAILSSADIFCKKSGYFQAVFATAAINGLAEYLYVGLYTSSFGNISHGVLSKINENTLQNPKNLKTLNSSIIFNQGAVFQLIVNLKGALISLSPVILNFIFMFCNGSQSIQKSENSENKADNFSIIICVAAFSIQVLLSLCFKHFFDKSKKEEVDSATLALNVENKPLETVKKECNERANNIYWNEICMNSIKLCLKTLQLVFDCIIVYSLYPKLASSEPSSKETEHVMQQNFIATAAVIMWYGVNFFRVFDLVRLANGASENNRAFDTQKHTEKLQIDRANNSVGPALS